VCSAFHSLRARFIYNPNSLAFTGPVVDAVLSNSYNAMMDINKTTEYSFLCPFFQAHEWLYMDIDATNPQDCFNGQFAIVMTSLLSSTLATPQPIYYQIFISMCDDAQFAAPCLKNINTLGNPYLADPSLLQEDDEEDLEFVAQSGEDFQTGLCELPSSSSMCLRNTVYTYITGKEFPLRRVYGESTAYEFSSVKQLSNMLTPMDQITSIDTTVEAGRTWNPFGFLGRAYNDNVWLNYYAQIRSVYLFGRGSARLVAFCTQPDVPAVGLLLPLLMDPSDYWIANTTNPIINATDLPYATCGFQTFPDTNTMPADITIPYYSINPCQLLLTLNTTDPHAAMSTGGAITFFNDGFVGATYTWFVGTGDDFVFGTPIGLPTLKHV
jgi:hypothetical protein